MYSRYMTLILLPPLVGCAATVTQDMPPATQDPRPAIGSTLHAEEAALAAGAVETVDVQELNQRTVCEQIRRTGSRIVVARRCYTPDTDAISEARRRDLVRRQMDDLRREQEAMERMAREREREIERQRAIMMQQGLR